MTRVWAILSLVLAGFLAVGCASEPCTPADTVMAVHAAECAARVRAECADVPDSECPAIKECDDWGNARCGVPQ